MSVEPVDEELENDERPRESHVVRSAVPSLSECQVVMLQVSQTTMKRMMTVTEVAMAMEVAEVTAVVAAATVVLQVEAVYQPNSQTAVE